MRPSNTNYNYNYNYAVSTSPNTKPHSANPYTKQYQSKQQNQSAAHYIIHPNHSLKYYPINDDEPAFNTVHSAKDSATSFYLNINPKEPQHKITQINSTKSPKSHQNWYLPQNMLSQMSLNSNQPDKSVNKNDPSIDSALETYISWLHTAFIDFQKTGNIKTLKQINQQNSLEIKKLHQQLLNEKESISSANTLPKSTSQISLTPGLSPRPKTPLNSQRISKLKQQINALQTESNQLSAQISKEHHISQELTHEQQQELQSRQNARLDQSHIRQSNHLKQMQESIVQLEEEIKTLQRKNHQLARGLVGLPFFKEWSIMFDQAKGANKLNLKLKHQITKRQTLIKQLTNEDPSNNSDARSVRRLPSENGQKPSYFKKQAKFLPKSLTKPQSQMTNKFQEKESNRSNDVVIRHLSHSNRFSQSKKTATVNNSVDKTKQRKQSYDQKPYPEGSGWKNMQFAQNLKNIGVNFIGKDVYK